MLAISIAEAPLAARAGLSLEEPADRSPALAAATAELARLPPLTQAPSRPQRRLALVVGVDDYAELKDLDKAVGDSRGIAEALTALGFGVTRLENVGADRFDEALDTFYDSLQEGDVAFFFFAGHGIAFDGVNFLLPADMPALDDVRASRLARAAVNAQEIMEQIRARGVETVFLVLDACRDSPFPQPPTRGARALGGLAEMEAQDGAFVLYSAGVGEQALDALGPADPSPYSVFTRIFEPALTTPGLPIVEIAKRTQVEVNALAATVHHRQAPAYYDQVVGQFYFQRPRPKIRALAIGIDDYNDGNGDLKGAVNDARLIHATLDQIGAEASVMVLDEDARLQLIDYVWRDLLEDSAPGDTIVLTYGGQAAQTPALPGSGETDGLDEVLVLAGHEPVQTFWAGPRTDAGRLLPDDRFTEWMDAAARKNVNVIVLIDGCHGGGLLDRPFANVTFIGASGEAELANEQDFGGRIQGVASYVFAQALRGSADLNRDGFITQRELFVFMDENVFRITGGRQNVQVYPATDDSSAGLALLSAASASGSSDLTSFWKLPASRPAYSPAR